MSATLEQAVQAIRQGRLVGMPTETVYGLAADALNSEAVLNVFRFKQRPAFDPLIVHVADGAMAARYAHVHGLAKRLMERFWPGPLTLVLDKQDCLPDEVTSGLQTVGVRCPDHPLALSLIRDAQLAVAAPSANSFGRISPTTADHVREQFDEADVMVLDGGPCRVGVESTVVGFVEDPDVEGGLRVEILRLGGLKPEEMARELGYEPQVLSLQDVTEQHLAMKSPGQLKSHYAPRIPLYLKSLEEEWVRDAQAAYLCWSEPVPFDCAACAVLSPGADIDVAASNLFAVMRKLENCDVQRIYAETIPPHGLGLAVNDRLLRASASSD